jgi:5-methylthioadenosine/S-adenosylhomocysteine deaminase
MDLVLSNATVLTLDDAGTILPACDVVVRGGAIESLGEGAAKERPQRVIDASDLLVMPGLVNGHTHSPETLAKGRSDCSTLETWLGEIWPSLDELEPRQIYVAALLGVTEMLHTGSIAVVDHFRQTPVRLSAVDAVAEAYRDSRMQAVIATMLRDIPQRDGQILPSAADQIAIVEEAHLKWSASGSGVRIALGPSAPTRCTDGLLVAAGDLASRHDLLFHIHVDETRTDVAEAQEHYGTTNVRHLSDLGLLTPATSLAHGVWLDDDDIGLLASAGSTVIHNPVSNMRLGSGIAPVTSLRERGVPVVLGTDGAASNDGQSVLEALKTAVLLQRVAGVDAEHWLSARQALSMATTTASRSFGFGTGQIEPGAPADFIAVRHSGYAFSPQNNWLRQLVFSAGSLDVRYAVVGGNLLLDDGRIMTFDEQAILAEAREMGPYIFAKYAS